MDSSKIGRNDPCPCGSGRKYKQCCLKTQPAATGPSAAAIAQLLETALAHHRAGRLQQASALYGEILAAQPNHPDALNLMGVVATHAGNTVDAVRLIQAAIAANPSNGDFYNNLGNALQAQGDLKDAVAAYDKAITLQPKDANAHFNAGSVLAKLELYEEADRCYRRALAIQPAMAEAHYNLGNISLETGQLPEAVDSFQKALRANPKLAVAHDNLGVAWRKLGRFEEALASHRNAILIDPGFAGAYINLGVALQQLGHFEEAFESYKKALSIRPDYADAYYNLGTAYQDSDRIEDAIASYRKSIDLKPGLIAAYSNLLYIHATVRDISPEQELEFARKWEHLALDEPARNEARNRKFVRSPRAGRRLKVGIVSAEIGDHAVAEFLEPLLQTLDRRRCHLTLFPTVFRPGARAVRIQALADAVHPIAGSSDANASAFIRSCEVDVLMDTTGHTRNCRLGIFAHRAAPVQLTYLGYWSTTGLTEMDWHLADDHIPPAFEHHFSEGIWRLPRLAVCYRETPHYPNTTGNQARTAPSGWDHSIAISRLEKRRSSYGRR